MVAIKRLSTVDADFTAKMDALLAFEAAADEGIERTVANILADVKQRGDAAVVDYSNKFDRLTATSMADLELSKAEMQKALDGLPADRRSALEAAAGRIRAYHERQKMEGWSYTEAVVRAPPRRSTDTAQMVHSGRAHGAPGRRGNYSVIPMRLRIDSPSI